MLKCRKCKNYKYKLKCLACEQEAEGRHKIVKPEIITPLKSIPLETLTDKEKAVLLLRIVAEVSTRRLSTLLGLSHPTISSIFARAKKKLKGLKML